MVVTKMASIMNSSDADSFISKNDFELGNKVNIDGSRQETLFKKISSTICYLYEVMLDGTELIITVRADNLAQFETEK